MARNRWLGRGPRPEQRHWMDCLGPEMSCSEASCRSSGCESHQRRGPATTVVISSGGEGDQTVESLDVKVPDGWETGRIRTEGRANWQAVANVRTVEAPKWFPRVKRICGLSGVPSR